MSMLTKRILFVTTMIAIFSQIVEQSSSAHLNSTNNHSNRHTSHKIRNNRLADRFRTRESASLRQRPLKARDLSSSQKLDMNPKPSETRTQLELPRPNNLVAPKRFKSSFKGSAAPNDLNNNSSSSSSNNSTNLNHNDIQVDLEDIPNQPRNWRRNVSSINGTIDVTEYQQNDLDRLYGDALLVYFKNFNE